MRTAARTLVTVAAFVCTFLASLLAVSAAHGSGTSTESAAPGDPTYRLEADLSYPYVDDEGESRSEEAGVHLTVEWSGGSYPGEATCEIALLASDGREVGRRTTSLASLMPSVALPTFPVAVDAPPTDAVATCTAADRGPDGGSYFFSSVEISADERTGGFEMSATAHWMNETSPGIHLCRGVWPDTLDRIEFTLGVSDGSRFSISVPEATAGAAEAVVLTCAPFEHT